MQTTMMSSITLALMLVPVAAEAQRIPHDGVVRDVRLYSEVAGRRPRLRYRGTVLEVVRRVPRRGLVVTERYRRFSYRVRPLWMSRDQGRRWLRRRGFRPITLYIKDGRYYHRVWASNRAKANPTLRPVVVWRRNGLVYRIEDRHLRQPSRIRRR